jgi:hypothetical protein
MMIRIIFALPPYGMARTGWKNPHAREFFHLPSVISSITRPAAGSAKGEKIGDLSMTPGAATDSQAQITAAIALLQDALKKEAFDKKAVHADVVKASNILLGLLGLPSVAPDPNIGN